jgi:hypothetical protein
VCGTQYECVQLAKKKSVLANAEIDRNGRNGNKNPFLATFWHTQIQNFKYNKVQRAEYSTGNRYKFSV